MRALSALVTLGRCDATDLLRRHADDEYLERELRADVLETLAKHRDDQLPLVTEYHRRVRTDATEAIVTRCDSAYRAQVLDLAAMSVAVDQLRQVTANPDLTVSERVSAIPQLHRMTYHATIATDFLAGALAQDPACGAAERKVAVGCMERKHRLAEQRRMLADRSIALEHRVPDLDRWGYQPLRRETEAAVRDVLTAPESTHAERVAAAATLAQLSSRFVAEAAALLGELGVRGQEELSKLGPRWSSQVRANARATIADETRPWRERWPAFRLVWTVEDGIAPRSDEQRMELAQARGEIGVVRAMLGNQRPATRWRAAKLLREYDVADRAAGADVLEAIGVDSAMSPALRWRAGETLTEFGAKGRERGVMVLRNVMADESLPVMARVEAASVVGKIRPDLRAEVMRFLRAATIDKPLQCIRLYQAIGVFEPEEGARALQAMTNDEQPVVRIRAAEVMVALRRDYRERAAVTALSVMRDTEAPRHVRRRAAGDLARWSDLCLEEARAFVK